MRKGAEHGKEDQEDAKSAKHHLPGITICAGLRRWRSLQFVVEFVVNLTAFEQFLLHSEPFKVSVIDFCPGTACQKVRELLAADCNSQDTRPPFQLEMQLEHYS